MLIAFKIIFQDCFAKTWEKIETVFRPLLVVGMIGMIHPNGDEFHPKAPCHWDEIHPNGWRLLAPVG